MSVIEESLSGRSFSKPEKDRYYIEHMLLPEFVFNDEQAPAVLDAIRMGQGEYFVSLYNFMNRDNPDYQCPYTESDFKIRFITADKSDYCIQITMPKPEREPLCKEVFIVHDIRYKYKRYFTYERGRDESTFLLCEWTHNHDHKLYDTDGDTPLHSVLKMIMKKK